MGDVEIGADELKTMATSLLRRAFRRFVEDNGNGREFSPQLSIIHPNRSIEFLPRVPGAIMEDPRAKARLFAMLGDYARQRRATATIVISDMFSLDYSAEQLRLMKEDDQWFEALKRISKEEGCAAAARAGYGTLIEGVGCMVQSRIFVAVLFQQYERLGEDRSRIVAVNELREIDSRAKETSHSGRMVTFYEDEEKMGHG